MAKTYRKLLQLQLQPFFTEIEIDDEGNPTLSESRNTQPFSITGKQFEEMDMDTLRDAINQAMNSVFPDEQQQAMNRQQRRAIERQAEKNGGELHAVETPGEEVTEPAEV